jgi:FMN phosphatase YigB (HAD superfamily)
VQKKKKAKSLLLTNYDDLFLASLFAIGIFFSADMLLLFGAKGLIKPATEFFTPLLFPFLSWHFV